MGRISRATAATFAFLGTFTRLGSAIAVDFSSDSSIKTGAATVAWGLVKYYTGNNTGDVAGNLPSPYYWWECGAMFGTLVDYWSFTGDDSYNEITKQAIVHQAGDHNDFMPTNQTRSEGNDDQGFWALLAMDAAEANFTNPGASEPQYLALVQAVFNEYVTRWDTGDCGGGIRWQIYTFNNGYNYKNSISNGCFFNIAARLGRFTGNETYTNWAKKIFDWEMDLKFITPNTYQVLDGASNAGGDNCTDVNAARFSYNAGVFLYGAAAMYNLTSSNGDTFGASTWKGHLDGILKSTTNFFFKNGIMYEPACETTTTGCNIDQASFKGHLARWMAMTTKVAPYTYDTIYPLLKSTATAAAEQCSGAPASGFNGHGGTACGFSWLKGSSFDGSVGVGQQMNALSALFSPLAATAPPPYTSKNGGSSQGDPDAGSANSNSLSDGEPITTAGRAGAGILTTVVLGGLLSGCVFMFKE